jgi:predicted ArsR family transcriptional regulator
MGSNPNTSLQSKLQTYAKLHREQGEESALRALFEGYPERQRERMGPLIEHNSLAEGFTRAIPMFRTLGFDMAVVDLSNGPVDAVLEIQRVCPALAIARELGLPSPCAALCELDVRATRAAFPGMRGAILARRPAGDCACLFKYERDRDRSAISAGSASANP